MKKIAIKYSEENWPEIKKVVDLIRSAGIKVLRRKESSCFNDKDSISKSRYLVFDEENCILNGVDVGFRYWYNLGSDDNDYLVLTMPQDMSKLKEFLGIEVPKDGEVWVSDSRIARIKNMINDKSADLHSQFIFDTKDCPLNKFQFATEDVLITYQFIRKATPEETTKLIEAEHANGYHWDGSSLVKIPEYVEIISTNNHTWQNDFNEGHIFKLSSDPINDNKFWRVGDGRLIDFSQAKPSTREAYEAQEVEKKRPIKLDFDKINLDLMCKCVTYGVKVKKPTKRIILNQYESIEILVDEFEMVHNNGKILLLPK